MAAKMKILLGILALATTVMSSTPAQYIKAGSDKLTANMFPEVVKDHENGACVQSAFSAMFPLAQLALGSQSTSHDDILKAIEMPSDDMIKQSFYSITSGKKNYKDIVIKMTNKFYLKVGYTLTRTFQDDVTLNFGVTNIANIDFANKDETVHEMNNWVGSQTDRSIHGLIHESTLTAATPAVILNAIYFKGFFAAPFDPDNTLDKEFYVDGIGKVMVPMMRNTHKYKYGESSELDATLLEIPFTDNEASLVIILPNEKTGIDSLMNRMKDPAILQRNVDVLSENTVDVGLPKFTIKTKTDFKKVMKNIQVSKLFTAGQAHIDKFIKDENTNRLYVREATQKAYINVNEEGSKATAALCHAPEINQQPTNVQNTPVFGSGPNVASVPVKDTHKSFVADHPFLFYVIEKTNNIVLFNGVFKKNI